jgi:hypothetical protein
MSRCDRAAVAALAILVGCTDEPLAGPGALGELDAARVVAVGDGYLAGVTDGALFASAQETSVPALFVRQAAPESDFRQPLVADPGLAIDDPGVGRLALLDARPLTLARLPRGAPLELELDRPYDNLGVPGALLAETLVAQSAASSIFGNSFYDLVLRGRGTAGQQAGQREASLVLLGLGTADVLTFIARGGDPALAPGLPTPPVTFASVYETLVDQLLEVTDQVVLFNIPDVTRFPILEAVPNVVLDPATGDTVLVTESVRVIDPVTGDEHNVQRQVPVRLLGPDGSLKVFDRVTPAALPLLAQGIGVPGVVGGTGASLPDRVVIDADEIVVVRDAVISYNEAIQRIADERRLVVVDVYGLVERLAAGGVVSDGVLLTTEWLRGQAFGLDGAYFTPKGYGVVTNLLIDAVNARYGSRLRHVRTADLRGISLLHL